jgi:hypothetical protein
VEQNAFSCSLKGFYLTLIEAVVKVKGFDLYFVFLRGSGSSIRIGFFLAYGCIFLSFSWCFFLKQLLLIRIIVIISHLMLKNDMEEGIIFI